MHPHRWRTTAQVLATKAPVGGILAALALQPACAAELPVVPAPMAAAQPVCPVALLVVPGGPTAAPQATVLFDASASHDAQGQPVPTFAFSWLESPVPMPPLILTAKAKASAQLHAIGRYVVRVQVHDARGLAACQPAFASVEVEPTAPVHIDLTWMTPGDADEADQGVDFGTDLDLHLLRREPPEVAKAVDWFHASQDVFWDNRHPDWGDPGPAHDPSLDRDDVDGGGPEIVTLQTPEPKTGYFVGVHHWKANGFGPARPRVRVYLHGKRVFNGSPAAGDGLLGQLSMWRIGMLQVSPEGSLAWVACPNPAAGMNECVQSCYAPLASVAGQRSTAGCKP